MATADLLVRIAADLSGFDRATQRAVSKIRTMANEFQSIGSTLSLSVTAPLVGFAAAALNASGDIDALRRGLTTLTGSAAETAKQMAVLREVAKAPGIGFQEAVQGSIRLQNVGFSAAGAAKTLKEFANAIAASGGGKAQLELVTVQLGQMANASKILMQDLRPIIQQVPQVASVLKDAFGTMDPDELNKKGVSTKQLVQTIVEGFAKMSRATGGIKNDFENMQTDLTVALAAVGDALTPVATRVINGFVLPVIAGIQDLAQKFTALPDSVQTAVIGFGGFVAAVPVFLFATSTMINSILTISSVLTKLGGLSIFTGLAANAGTFAFALSAGLLPALTGVELVMGGLAFAVTGVAAAWASWNVTKWISEVTGLQDVVDDLWAKVGVGAGAAANKAYIASLAFIESGKKMQAEQQARIKLAADINAQTELFTAKAKAQSAAQAASAARQAAATRLAAAAIGDFSEAFKGMSAEITKGNMLNSVAEDALKSSIAFRILTAETKLQESATNAMIQTMARVKLGIVTREVFELAEELPKLASGIAFAEKEFNALDVATQAAAAAQERLNKAADEFKAANPAIFRKRPSVNPNLNEEGKELEKATKDAEKAVTIQERLAKQVSLIVNDLARDITDLIFKGGKLKDVLIGTFESIGKALLRAAIENQLKKIAKVMTDMIGTGGKLGKVLGAVFGGGSSAASSAGSAAGQAAGGAASAAGSIGGAGGQVAGAAASGVAGVVTAVAGVVTAISSVVGNFQMAGMNKSLDLIVNHTLRTANQLIEGIQPQINAYLPYLRSIHDRLVTIVDSGINVRGSAVGGGDVYVKVEGADAAALIRQLKQMGAIA